MGDTMEKQIDKTIEDIEQESEKSDDPELFKARLVSKLEREIANDHDWREG